MQAMVDQFRSNIRRVHSMAAVYLAISNQTTPVLDLSDLLRSEWVMAVSALDHYVPEIVRMGMLEAYYGNRPKTNAFLRFQITMDRTLQAISEPMDDKWLEDQIKSNHGHRSFQTPDPIAGAIRLISDTQMWDAVATQLSLTPQYTREKLSLIGIRRNQIAHEADTYPSYGDRLWPIDFAMVDDTASFVEQLSEAIHATVA